MEVRARALTLCESNSVRAAYCLRDMGKTYQKLGLPLQLTVLILLFWGCIHCCSLFVRLTLSLYCFPVSYTNSDVCLQDCIKTAGRSSMRL
jgi:hypothetical protein